MKTQQSSFGAYSTYYDLLYHDKDYNGETDYIHKTLSDFGVNDGDVLEFGSGTGKHGRLLAARGYKVHGIEFSQEMLDSAIEGNGFTCERGDICQIRLGRMYDAVISLFHVMSYQVTNENIKSALINAGNHLEEGGIFIFDFWYTPAVHKNVPSVRVKRFKNNKVNVTRIAEPVIHSTINSVDVNYSIFIHDIYSNDLSLIEEKHSMRHFSIPEIDLLSELTGFERIRTEEFLTGNDISDDTWGVCVVLRKI